MFPEMFNRMISLIESTIGAFGYSGERENDAMGNANGLLSRTEQWSGITWTFMNGRYMTGFGNKCHTAYLVKYFRDGMWTKTSTFDVGYVAIFCQYGIMGTIAFFKLYYSRIKTAIDSNKLMSSKFLNNKDVKNNNNLSVTFLIFFIAYLVNLLTCTGVDKFLYIVIALQIAFCNINKDK